MFAPKEAYVNSSAFLAREFESDKTVEYSINLENVKDVYASELSLSVSGLKLKLCTSTAITKNFLIEENVKDGILKIALAGAEPVNKSAGILKLKFEKLIDNAAAKFEEAFVNETEINVTAEALTQLPDNYDLKQNYSKYSGSESENACCKRNESRVFYSKMERTKRFGYFCGERGIFDKNESIRLFQHEKDDIFEIKKCKYNNKLLINA